MKKKIDIAESIEQLRLATANDPDPVSCLVLGPLPGGFKKAKVTVFIVRKPELAEQFYKFLLNQNLTSQGHAIKGA